MNVLHRPAAFSSVSGQRALGLLTAWALLSAIAATSRADIAVLREKGPKSGGVFANPGLSAVRPEGLKVAMHSAEVKIHLRPAAGGNLTAECVATFEMKDASPTELNGQGYLVAFPVTGLKSKILTVERFQVTVDGQEPPSVFRRNIALSRREFKRDDTPITGQLDARLALDVAGGRGMVALADKSGYPDAYVWQQTARPGSTVHVRVSYTTTLRPQSIQYSKSYERADDDSEVIPFSAIEVDRWNERYFFFDYVLRSGATWDGPIGQETIEISADPALGLKPYGVICSSREPVGYRPHDAKPLDWTYQESSGQHGAIARTSLKAIKPGRDILVTIPISAIKSVGPTK